MFVSVVERQRAILEDRISHSCLAKVLPDFMLAGMCVPWLHSRGNDRE